MTAFQLDTSGHVPIHGRIGVYVWSDLDAFTQGYIEAMFQSACNASGQMIAAKREGTTHRPFVHVGFSYLAPKTLARIIADCSSFENFTSGLGFKTGAVEGQRFWNGRASKSLAGAWGAAFPPLTVRLGDDGRVYLLEAAQ